MPRRSHAPAPIAAPVTPEGTPPSPASVVASEIKAMLASGARDDARERFSALVDLLHRRALRIAYYYLRDADDAAEAVQDAFLKVFLHMPAYSETRPFEVWFTKILVNGCLDRQKSRSRRLKWTIPAGDASPVWPPEPASTAPSPEARLLSKARAGEIAGALAELPSRQRQVFVLRYLDGQSPAYVGEALGLTEATVRVHLFRALRRLRGLLER